MKVRIRVRANVGVKTAMERAKGETKDENELTAHIVWFPSTDNEFSESCKSNLSKRLAFIEKLVL